MEGEGGKEGRGAGQFTQKERLWTALLLGEEKGEFRLSVYSGKW